MRLTWMGHSCFLMEEAGYRIAVDPYTGVEGYPELQVTANAVYCSHDHFDHHAVERVHLVQGGTSPFSVKEVPTFHDDRQGALRGNNMVRVFSAGGVRVAHLGDLGHQLTQQQIEAIGAVDGVLVPVGGVYTVDADGARKVCEALAPRWIVPMHYRHSPYGLPNIGGVEEFLRQWPQVHFLPGASFTADGDTQGVIVPQFVAEA